MKRSQVMFNRFWVSLIGSAFSISVHAQATDKTYVSEGQKFKLEILTEQKDVIWGFDFLDEKQIIFTERSGAIKILNLADKKVSAVSGAPKVWAQGQGGLLDIRVSPTKPDQIYLTYAEPVGKDNATTALGVATLNKNELQGFKRLFSGIEPSDEDVHFGSRIEFDGKGHLFFSMGDRNARSKVMDLKFHNGKMFRLNLDGSVPSDNPFFKDGNAKPEIWSFGHRSPQGLTRDPLTGNLWEAEMGPRGGDELNLIEAGNNYGWPEVTYGREYSGFPLGVKKKAGTVLPVAHWVPSISPSAITLYRGKKFPKWEGNIFVACLSGMQLRRVILKDKQVLNEEKLLDDLNYRFRNVRAGIDGYLYFSTDGGVIARLIPTR